MNVSGRLVLGGSLALLALASCSERSSSAAPSARSDYFITIRDPDGGTDLEVRVVNGEPTVRLRGRTFDVDDRVKLDYEFLAGSATRWTRPEGRDGLPDSPTGMWLAHQPVSLDGGRLHIGARDYGEVPEGCTIHVAPEGVEVDGELRGELP